MRILLLQFMNDHVNVQCNGMRRQRAKDLSPHHYVYTVCVAAYNHGGRKGSVLCAQKSILQLQCPMPKSKNKTTLNAHLAIHTL